MGSIMHSAQELYWVIFLAAAFIAIIVSYFIYVFVRQKKFVMSWQEARIKAEIERLEHERKRIATDLHDDIGPMLSALKLHVNHVAAKNQSEQLIMTKSLNIIDEVIQHFRDISYDLLPNTLVRKGIIEATVEFVEKMNEAQRGLIIEFEYDPSIQVAHEAGLNLYRIIQEITHNTIKHAGASSLKLALHSKNDQLVFSSKDNGKGFMLPSKQASYGMGLLNIQNRLTLLNGKMNVDTKNGTMYLITIPI